MEVVHVKEKGEFYTEVNGHKAYITYTIRDNSLDIRHTCVPKPIGGKGIAAALVKEAYDYAREQGFQCTAGCSYAVAWLQRHPEYMGTPSADYVEGACPIK